MSIGAPAGGPSTDGPARWVDHISFAENEKATVPPSLCWVDRRDKLVILISGVSTRVVTQGAVAVGV